jgi:predicted amidohydrolase
MFLASVVQMTSTSDEPANLAQAEALIARAAARGAALIATPENTNFLGPHGDKVSRAQPLDGPLIARFSATARRHGVHLLLGSYNERSDEPHRCYNTSVLFGPDGAILGSYRKIHLFDVNVSPEVSFLESSTCKPGKDPVVVTTGLGAIGLSICYDLRFPELYRRLVDLGAEILMIPAAFTATTGKDHWEVLLRARAIEAQCYVLAPGQHGFHDDHGLRNSHGHSAIIDPWGHVIGRASDGPGLAFAEIDLARVRKVRQGIPLADHRRL